MAITLKQIAAKAGVAPTTVSAVLNGRTERTWISKPTREKVIKVARDMGYRPNRLARGLRLGTYSTVGLVVPDLLNPFYAAFARALEKHLDQEDQDLLIEDSEANLEREKICLGKMLNRQIDGLICFLMDPGGCGKLLASEERRVICIGRRPPGISADVFRSDFEQGMAEAVAHLTELGHKRIAFVSGMPEGQSVDQRVRLFRNLVRKHGLPFSEKHFLKCGHTMGDARTAFHQYWQETSPAARPTALIALNDLLAIGVMRAALDLGLEVPRDLSIIGVDNTEIAETLPIPLTTIALSYEEMAAAVAQRFFERKRNRELPPADGERVFPTRLVIRQSTAPVPGTTRSDAG